MYFTSYSPASSDGYQALPTKVWGTHYIHCSYYDVLEYSRSLGGGFNIVAAEDSTEVLINLRGVSYVLNDPGATTEKGRKINDVISVTLHKGQTYQVRGAGKTHGQFDLTGTEVISTKP